MNDKCDDKDELSLLNMGESDCRISVICPMYNEEIGIERNLDKLLAALNGLSETWELILVNDGSVDRCLELAQAKLECISQARIVSYRANRGRGYALRQGFAVARGDYIITTESDLSWGADIVAKLLNALEEQDVDMVIASPFMPGGQFKNVPFTRVFLSKFGNKILTLASGGNLTMISGMTRGYCREVIKSLFLEEDGKEIHLEIVSQVRALGFQIKEIPAILKWEKADPTKPSRKSSFNAKKLIWSHLLFSFTEKPFLLLGTLGIVFVVLGILLILYLAYQSIFFGIRAGSRPLLIIAALFFLSGLQVLLFSFNAHQISQQRKLLTRMRNKILIEK